MHASHQSTTLILIEFGSATDIKASQRYAPTVEMTDGSCMILYVWGSVPILPSNNNTASTTGECIHPSCGPTHSPFKPYWAGITHSSPSSLSSRHQHTTCQVELSKHELRHAAAAAACGTCHAPSLQGSACNPEPIQTTSARVPTRPIVWAESVWAWLQAAHVYPHTHIDACTFTDNTVLLAPACHDITLTYQQVLMCPAVGYPDSHLQVILAGKMPSEVQPY